ncbi:MAG TPA: helix-turn-helix domain-containing protein [Turneriella sp.]|nr:helix-turn-helix domain-containing protein [Turneriella sp.]
MRFFMEYQADILPVVEQGRIVGQIDRDQLIEAMSEFRPEGCSVTIKDAESTDELLKYLDSSGQESMVTINRNFDFNALFSRAEIIQNSGRIPKIKVWAPPVEPEPVDATFRNTQPIPSQEKIIEKKESFPTPQLTQKEEQIPTPLEHENAPRFSITRKAVEINIKTKTETTKSTSKTVSIPHELPQISTEKNNDKSLATNLHRELERGRLAINTLATLDLPLMACDGTGVELFHNRPFADIRLRDGLYLKTDTLIRRAKDAITESAHKGELDIDKALELKEAPRGFHIFCKAIRNYDDPSARAVGYIFWLTATTPNPTPIRSDAIFSLDPDTSFSGRTLPEILAAEEARAMAWAMREANDNQSDAALLLGIPRQTFNYRYRKLMRQLSHLRKNEKHTQNNPPIIDTP